MPAKTSIPGLEVYFKPNTGQVILRKEGVDRKSEKVKEQNIRFAAVMTGKNLPGACKQPTTMAVGKRYKAFKACLFVKGKQAFGKTI